MLYLLTGDVQIGKSRWLTQLVDELSADDITCYGVLAPGDWVPSTSPKANADGFEKRGIWNVLLPGNERIKFAERKDLAQDHGTFDPESQAEHAGLGWHISEEALNKVNDHFAHIETLCDTATTKGLLVIDELGRLELQHNGGLTEAIRLLERGPFGCIQDALVVSRETLTPIVEDRFSKTWGGCERISPDSKTL